MNSFRFLFLLFLFISSFSYADDKGARYIEYTALGGRGCAGNNSGNGQTIFKSNLLSEYGCITQWAKPFSIKSFDMINDYKGNIVVCGTTENDGKEHCTWHDVRGKERFCPPGLFFDESSGQCMSTYCESPGTLKFIEESRTICSEKKGEFSFVCYEEEKKVDTECIEPSPEPDCNPLHPDYPDCKKPETDTCKTDHPNYPDCLGSCTPGKKGWPDCDGYAPDKPPCKIGGSNWPQCEDWYEKEPDPLDPIEPPDIDESETKPPKDIDIVDDKKPDYDNDERIINSIQNLNRDMNMGFSDVNNALQIQTNIMMNNNSLLVSGLQQDLMMHKQQVKNDNRNADNIIGALGDLSESVDGIEFVDSDDTDEQVIVDALKDIEEKIPGACDIATDPTGCEFPHGLNEGYVGLMFSQLNSVATETLDNANGLIESTLNKVSAEPPIAPSNVEPFQDSIIRELTSYKNCTPLDIFGYQLSCDFSRRFKSVFSYILYVWTFMRVADILLTEVTPVQLQRKRR